MKTLQFMKIIQEKKHLKIYCNYYQHSRSERFKSLNSQLKTITRNNHISLSKKKIHCTT